MDYKDFSDYQVTLHNGFKHAKIVKVKKCKSKVAAVRLADAIEKINNPYRQGQDKFIATMAYPMDENGKVLFKE